MKVEHKVELSEKELFILKNFAAGLLREEIAEKLFISPKTLRCYLHSIYQKLGVKKLHQAVVWYYITHFDLIEKCGC